MSGPNGACNNPAVPTSFSNTDSPVITSGRIQTGNWQEPVGSFDLELIDGVASECRIFITGIGVKRISNSLQQCSLAVSLTAGTAQLHAEVSDALNGQQQSATLPIIWSSDNVMIATVDQTGKVTLVRKGQAVISARYSRGVNPTSSTTTPSTTEAQCVYADCLVSIGA
jgi:hypothetical protein